MRYKTTNMWNVMIVLLVEEKMTNIWKFHNHYIDGI